MLLRKNDRRAWYGPREIERAADKGAIERGGGTLLISDALFRAKNVAVRRCWVELVRDEEGGEVRMLSSEHESGKQLDGLGGIVAILTIQLDDLDEVKAHEEVDMNVETPEHVNNSKITPGYTPTYS